MCDAGTGWTWNTTPWVIDSGSCVSKAFKPGGVSGDTFPPDRVDKSNASNVATAMFTISQDGTWHSSIDGPMVPDRAGVWLPAGFNAADYAVKIYSEMSLPYEAARFTTGWLPMDSAGFKMKLWDGQEVAPAPYVTFSMLHIPTGTIISQDIFYEATGTCFAVGTDVMLADGSWAPIETLKKGTRLAGFASKDGTDQYAQSNWAGDFSALKRTTGEVTAASTFKATKAVSVDGLVSTPAHVYFVRDASTEKFRWAEASEVLAKPKQLHLVDQAGADREVKASGAREGEHTFVRLTTSTHDFVVRDRVTGQSTLVHNLSNNDPPGGIFYYLPTVNGVPPGSQPSYETKSCGTYICSF